MIENAAINTYNISKCFGNFSALKDLTISIQQGEIFGFIGRNGAGKTTFMRILSGLMKPSSGTLAVKGRISFLPQNVRFRDKMDGQQVIRFFAELKNCSAADSIEFAKELDVDLTKKINNLSPGQQRKLQLAITLIGSPEILILDEPTAGLDPTGVQQVREIIKTFNQRGCTVFISSHVLKELENLCNTIAVIENGELLYQGACSTVYEIETEGMEESVLEALCKTQKLELRGNILIADVERLALPSVLQRLNENNVKVFGVKSQGIETLYNRLMEGGLEN